jgi:hypothetical protein
MKIRMLEVVIMYYSQSIIVSRIALSSSHIHSHSYFAVHDARNLLTKLLSTGRGRSAILHPSPSIIDPPTTDTSCHNSLLTTSTTTSHPSPQSINKSPLATHPNQTHKSPDHPEVPHYCAVLKSSMSPLHAPQLPNNKSSALQPLP